MMSKNAEKIDFIQLSALMIISRVFSEAAFSPFGEGYFGMQRFTVIAVSFLLTAVAAIPLYIIAKDKNGKSFAGLMAGKSKTAAAVCAVIFSAAALYYMSDSALRTHYYASSTIFDAAPSSVLYVFLGIGCLYALYCGLQTTARVGFIVSAGLLLLLIMQIFGLFSEIKPDRLYPALIERPSTFISEVTHEFSLNCELLIFAALSGRVKRLGHLCLPLGLGISCFFILLMTFLCTCVFGELLPRLDYPFYTLSSITDVGIMHRINGIDVMVWMGAAVIKLTLLSLSVRQVIFDVFGNKKAAFITAVSFAAGALLLSELMTVYPDIPRAVQRVSSTGVIILAAAVLIPALSLVCSYLKKKGGGGNEK